MSFVHGWAIAIGAAALAAPLLVHWLTSPRPRQMPLSTIRFVQELVAQRRSRNRLRDFLILATRCAAVALLAFAIARPLWGERTTAETPDASGDASRIVLIDASASMGTIAGGIETMQRARPLAMSHLDNRRGLRSNVIVMAATPRPVFDRPSTNIAALCDEIGPIAVRPERLNLQPALNLAGEMLAAAGDQNASRELIVISDFQRSNWASADFSVIPEKTKIRLESAAPETTPSNLAVTRAGVTGWIERGLPFQVEVEVGNYSRQPRTVVVEVALGEQLVRLQGNCPAGARTVFSGESTAAAEGWLVGEARLVGIEDSLPADNTCPIAVEVHAPSTLLLLTRQPPESAATSSYFLERGLSPFAREANRPPRIRRVDPLNLERETLLSADIILLDHPGKLSEETITVIVDLLRRGRGVFYVASEPIDAVNLKRLVEASAGGLRLPVEFSPPTKSREKLVLAELQRRQRPFSIFGDAAADVFNGVRFGGGLASRRVDGGLPDDIHASFNDLSTALVVSGCGTGTLAILNADLGASNLPASSAFVPLLGEIEKLLLGSTRSTASLLSGEPWAAFLPASAGPANGLRVSTNRSRQPAEELGEIRDESLGAIWRGVAAGPPAVYELKRGERTVFAAASVLPPVEADLTALSPDVLTQRLAGGRDVRYRSGSQLNETRDDGWTWFAVACIGCLFSEIIGLKLFRT